MPGSRCNLRPAEPVHQWVFRRFRWAVWAGLVSKTHFQFAINDQVTISYNDDSHEATDKGQIADGNASRTTNIVSMDATSYQIAYNIGGATVGLFHVDTDNSEFTAGLTETKTIASIAMEF